MARPPRLTTPIQAPVYPPPRGFPPPLIQFTLNPMNDSPSPMDTPPAPPSTDPQTSHRDRDPLKARIVAILAAGAVATIMLIKSSEVWVALESSWVSLGFWTLLAFSVSLFPVAVEDFRLTLDLPILLAAGIVFSPEAAALVAFIASADLREIRREVSFSHALFNRAQIALSVYAAALVFHAFDVARARWWLGLVATAAAVLAEYAVNVGLVAAHAATLRRGRWRQLLRKLRVGTWTQFLVSYLAYGALALVMAQLYQRVGAWSVVAFFVPIMVARQALLRSQELQLLTGELMTRERLLQRLFERMTDERRDERLRIAGELHDETLQVLTKLWLSGRSIENSADSGVPLSEIHELMGLCESASDSLRHMIHDLRRSPLGRGGLVSCLRSLVADLRLDWKRQIELKAPERIQAEPAVQVALYQIAREAILNALKHAEPSAIRIAVELEQGRAALVVEDDGPGFESRAADSTQHFGLDLMRERARSVGGRLSIQSQAGKGTRLRVAIPLQEPRLPTTGLVLKATN